mgnify:CR=1 FL=1
MDNQLKRGMLDALVLSVLIKGDSYGYQIIKDLKPAIDVSESTLYPILKRLETGKFLSVYSVAHNGRLRKYYRISELGNLSNVKGERNERKTDIYPSVEEKAR